LFKRLELKSVADEQIVRTLVSSGTTGASVSRVYLDKETARAQATALARIVGHFIGPRRLPMVILDDNSLVTNRIQFNARGAATLGFSNMGRDHFYALDGGLEPKWGELEGYLRKHAGDPILVFGFTFLVWQFVQKAAAAGVGLRFPGGSVLIHGGGWKKLQDRKVGNEVFKAALRDTFGLERVHNYYGMVEQVGSIFFECEAGWLHAPAYADVLVRDRMTLEPLAFGGEGLIQVLSTLPRSYPGHSLLTEDLGTIAGEDDCPCGRMGKRFVVAGRLPQAELRGCSDTRVMPT
jgi:phenylacetate-coenzyme A ligase PaaK-like adenylate-forming protein